MALHAARPNIEAPKAIDEPLGREVRDLLQLAKQADLVLILADHDGTFKEHEANSELVWPTEAERELLRKFERHPKYQFYFVTGRPMDWFFNRYGEHTGLGISANHGVVEKELGKSDYMPLHGLREDWKEAIPLLEDYLARIPKSRIERKLGLVFHWKESEDLEPEIAQAADATARDLYAKITDLFQGRPVKMVWSDKGKYFEILPDDARLGKGEAALRILRGILGDHLENQRNILVLTAGDESSDNEMHSVVRELSHQQNLKTFTLKIGENHLQQSTAEYWIRSPKDFREILDHLLLISHR